MDHRFRKKFNERHPDVSDMNLSLCAPEIGMEKRPCAFSLLQTDDLVREEDRDIFDS